MMYSGDEYYDESTTSGLLPEERRPRQPQPRFTLGQLVATPGALAALVTAGESPTPYLTRHLAGDFGTMDAEDSALNRADIRRGNGRVFSAYLLADGTKIWVITNLIDGYGYDTCVLLPSEY